MPKIVISYRRADSDAIAGRIRDRLASYYGEESVFMDIDNIPFGIDFRDHIRDALFENDFIVVVVGPRWLGQGKGTHLRIKEENDPVRIEVETALERGIPVIPVLVNGATMPKPSELPDSLTNFAYRNAAEVDTGRDFHQHMDRLIRSMDQVLKRKGVATPAASLESTSAPSREPAVETVVSAPAVSPSPPTAPTIAASSTPVAPVPPPPAETPASAAPLGLMAPAPPPAPPPAPRLGMVLALTAVASSVLSVVVVGGALWFSGVRPFGQDKPVDHPAVVNGQPQTPVVAPACKTDTPPVFQDNFAKPDSGWGLVSGSQNTYYDQGQMVVKADPNSSSWAVYRSLLYRNATFCLNIRSPVTADDLSATKGGLVFWGIDYSNFYMLIIDPEGSYQVFRRLDANWVNATSRTKSDAIKTGLGAVNQVVVSTVGNVATLVINGKKIMDLTGQPPKSGGSFGMYGESEKSKGDEWRFIDITVTELPASQTPVSTPPDAVVKAMLSTCQAGSTAAFADDFKSPNPGWVNEAIDNSRYVDGHLLVKPASNKMVRIANWSFVFRDSTACADIKSPSAFKNAGDTAAGLIFWATDISNFYVANIYPDGSYIIRRSANGTIVDVSPKTKFAGIKAGAGGENRVKITTSGTTATLYINEAKVQDFRGQPPTTSSVGLYTESEVDQEDEWTFLGIVVSDGQ